MTPHAHLAGAVGRSLGAAGGLALDRMLGEPPTIVHPVARFGELMLALEERTYRDTRAAGTVHLLIGAGGAAALGWWLRKAIGNGPATAVAAAVSIGGRMLGTEATAVARLVLDDDMPAARLRIRSLVGRDTASSDAAELSRAAIESLAENTVDAVTSPLFWGFVGGAPAVLAHRAINTLDAMVGHRNERYARFGWASARADDFANWVPARLSALAVAALVPHRTRAVVHAVRRDAPQHPSPNGGVIEAAFAAALDIQLGGTNVYDGHAEARGVLGSGRAASATDIGRATALADRLATSIAAAGVTVGLVVALRRRAMFGSVRS